MSGEGFASSCVRIAASDTPIGLGFWLSRESTLAQATDLALVGGVASGGMKSAAWADPERWGYLCHPAGCPICQAGAPLDVVAESESTWITAGSEAQLPAYACVVSKRHAVEPFQLPEPHAAAFWSEAMTAARVLAEFSGAVKMNYGIHGNVIPHLHLHLWPRYVDDPYDTGGIPADGVTFTRSDAELHRMGAALRTGFSGPAS